MDGIIQQIAYFITPFGDIRNNWVDPLLIIVAPVWTAIVIDTGIGFPDSFPVEDINVLSAVLAGTLGFLLPLYLSNAIEKNRSGITLYEAYCGDVVALAWEVASYGDEVKPVKDSAEAARIQLEGDLSQSDDNAGYKELRRQLFDIMREMPMVIKHVFRDDFDYSKIETANVGEQMRRVIKGDNDPIEAMMFLLVMRLRRIPSVSKRNGGDILQIMMKKWNDIYSSYGTTSSLITYKEPLLFQYVLYTAMTFYILLLPFTFSKTDNWNNVWLSGLVIYFFISLNSAGKLMQNPFISLKTEVFATVSETSRNTVRIIDRIRDYGSGDFFNEIRLVEKAKRKLRRPRQYKLNIY